MDVRTQVDDVVAAQYGKLTAGAGQAVVDAVGRELEVIRPKTKWTSYSLN